MAKPSPSLAIFTTRLFPIPSSPFRRLPLPSGSASRSAHLHSSPIRMRAPPVPSSHAGIPPARPTTLGSGLNGSGSSAAVSAAAASAAAAGKKKSGHLIWYREIVPAMLPILLLSTTLFLLLALSRTHLSSERRLAESQSQISALERQLSDLRTDARRRLEKERRERERMLPLVVERVLTKVGALRGGEAEEEEREREEGRRRDERERALLA